MRKVCALAAVLIVTPAPAFALVSEGYLQLSFERLLSALKVSGSQISASLDQTRTTDQQSRQALAATLGRQDAASRIAQETLKRGSETGMGYGVCSSHGTMRSEHLASASVMEVFKALADQDRGWLSAGGNALARQADLLEARRSFYCSADEREAGICNGAAGLAAGSTDASVFMMATDIGPEEAMIASDYLDQVIPLPTIDPARQSAEGEVDRLNARREGAFRSAARSAMFSLVAGSIGGDDSE